MNMNIRSVLLISAMAGVTGVGNVSADSAQTEAVMRGEAHYLFFCGACHGADANGVGGPNAKMLKIAPSDLTALRQTGDACIAERVLQAVSGRHEVATGQDKYMPSFSENLESRTVYEITQYLKTIQK